MRLSRKLGPRARRLAASHDSHVVEGLVQVARNADIPHLKRQLERLGAHVHVPARDAAYIRIDIPSESLNEVAAASDVLYVEAGELFAGVGS